MKKRIAVIGTGISGLTLSYMLNKQHDLTIFESEPQIGGHTATKDVAVDGQSYAIDTGFIVFNDWTYPNFIRLMDELGVESQPTSMGFSLSCAETGLEYSGANLGTLFAQKKNLFSPGHWQMLADILRFNKESIADLEKGRVDPEMSLGKYLKLNEYGRRFRDFYLIPMASAIWSSGLKEVEQMPLQFFVSFFKNHGLLCVKERPQWRVIKGGSRSYLEPLTRDFADRVRLNCPVFSVRRTASGVVIDSPFHPEELFDEVVFACHSDQALAILSDPKPDESRILGAIPYSHNEVVLHTDTSLLPKNKTTWSSWNYLLGRNRDKAVLTYNMNILQGLDVGTTFCVTMNDSGSINPEKILGRYSYSHPEFLQKGIEAQRQWAQINGVNNTWFCGAYWRNGFHEDGVVSALRVAEQMQISMAEVA